LPISNISKVKRKKLSASSANPSRCAKRRLLKLSACIDYWSLTWKKKAMGLGKRDRLNYRNV